MLKKKVCLVLKAAHIVLNEQILLGLNHFLQICPGLNANEMHVLYDRHHEVSSLIKVHQNTPNSVKYEVMWKCQKTQSNMKYILNPGYK